MRIAKRSFAAAATWLAMSSVASGYYHYVYYQTRSAPYRAALLKFDLNALDSNTVPILISENGPAQLAAGDTLAAIVSQVRLAAKVWGGVDSSALGLKFGGLFTPGTQHTSPVVEVTFEELPPGVLGLTSLTPARSFADSPAGPFVPIVKSTIMLNRDLSQQPSWSESLFLTLSHEMGHSLGLQHSLTSSLMSTNITRATTKAAPLAIDDAVGLSLLYPSQAKPLHGGSIQGRVSVGGIGVTLASVVAIALDGTAISAMTAPDGSYRIDGVPAGSYYIYVHALPPAIQNEQFNAGITPALDIDGKYLGAGLPFDTLFYPGVKDITKAAAVVVDDGGSLPQMDFNVTARQSLNVFGVQTYSFPGQVAVKPAYLTASGGRPFMLATGYGLTSSAGVGIMGGSAVIPNGGVKPYTYDPRYLQMDLQFNILSGEGARHLTFLADGDLYVLPAAFRITKQMPPQIASLTPALDANAQRVVVIAGSGLTADTQVLFDGQPAVIRSVDEANGAITVVPPPASPGQRVAVVALNRDGQSSLFLQATPPVYEYDAGDAAAFSISPAQLAAGTETMVEIQGINTNFASGYANFGIGSSGISVKRMWVAGPNRIVANVAVAPNAGLGNYSISLLNGLRLMNQSGGFQILAGNPRQSMFTGPIVDPVTGRSDIPAGGVAAAHIAGPDVDAPLSSLQLTVNDRAAAIVSYGGGLLVFRVPDGLAPGPAVVKLTANGDTVMPAVMGIDQVPPVIQSITASGSKVDASRPARPGELLAITVAGLADAGASVAASRVVIHVGNLQILAAAVTPTGAAHKVEFVLDAGTPTGNLAMTVIVDGRPSAAVVLPVLRGTASADSDLSGN